MSHFEYLSVLVSIVIALGLSEVAVGWGRILRRRALVRFYWLHTVWSVFILLFMIQFWWGFWTFRDKQDWSFPGLLAVMAECLVMVLAALVLVPDAPSAGGLDLRRHYYDQSPLFFGLGFLLLLLLGLVDALVGGQPFLHVENAIRGAGLGIAAGAALTSREGVHSALAVTGILLFAWFTVSAIYW